MLTLPELFKLLAESERQINCLIEFKDCYNTVEFFTEMQNIMQWRSSIKDEIIKQQAELLELAYDYNRAA